ncbi:uncharacterized protein SPPG_07322 [Spizellomyces punctatus DAOM BR117]|uniref:Uncharacterized protein n=1 Tax=Spizellomyces punctatus (strain DAOM BR117) TaxID=645134 RepID=A0A0L0H779_SPIPD|nr:uncharacterized protein SPPG_07322 [Spizellomyces punctatus DAOM BR117]KNC97395.1 hypothetical protein SPPG_07322 [Spizellomyces punctatus DAOM BR117]|eukprot:XP_016605435.1 hypothetical protein SPPG_07322 [Spizellomyces punctatus DAOM BR117]
MKSVPSFWSTKRRKAKQSVFPIQRPLTVRDWMLKLEERDKLEKELAKLKKEDEMLQQEIRTVDIERQELKRRRLLVEEPSWLEDREDELRERLIELIDRTSELIDRRSELYERREQLYQREKELRQKKKAAEDKLIKETRKRRRAQARVVTRVLTSLRFHREMGALRKPMPSLDDAAPAADGASQDFETSISKQP